MTMRSLLGTLAVAAVLLGCSADTATTRADADATNSAADALAFADTPGCSAAVEHLLKPLPVAQVGREAADDELVALLEADLPEVADALVEVRQTVEFWANRGIRTPTVVREVQAIDALNQASMDACEIPFGTLMIALDPTIGCYLSEEGTPPGMPWPNPGCEGGPPAEMPDELPCFVPRQADDPDYSPFYLGHPDDLTSFRAVDCASEMDVVLRRGKWEVWQDRGTVLENTDIEEQPALPPASTEVPANQTAVSLPPPQTTTP